MTLKQWLIHLWYWILTFPLPNKNHHGWIGKIGDPHLYCLTCGAEMIEDEEEE